MQEEELRLLQLHNYMVSSGVKIYTSLYHNTSTMFHTADKIHVGGLRLTHRSFSLHHFKTI